MNKSISSYGILTTDQKLVIKTWNEWLENASGMSLEQVAGKKISEIIPDLESRGLANRLIKALNQGTVEVLSSVFNKYLIKCEIKNPDNSIGFMKQQDQKARV